MENKYETLTEPMFYVLMAFKNGPKSGVEIVEYVRTKTNSRVPLAPGTLYTILGKFEKDNLIKEISVDGRKRTYELTHIGDQIYLNEINRLLMLLEDAKEEHHEN